jgi:hypothetical protein
MATRACGGVPVLDRGIEAEHPELATMADDYGEAALSQRAALEAVHAEVLTAAASFDRVPVLRVADLGAADGVNSHGLIRKLIGVRGGRPLVYALVDLPTNRWPIAARHLRREFFDIAGGAVILPNDDGEPRDDSWAADAGSGNCYASAAAHAKGYTSAARRAAPPSAILTLVGVPLHEGTCTPAGSLHVGVSGTAMHWLSGVARLASTGSVFPGHADHAREEERTHWAAAAAAQWRRQLELRARELAPGGYLVIAVPASTAPWPNGVSVYHALVHEMNLLLAEWRATGRLSGATAARIVVPVWNRTLEEIRAPFDEGGGRFAGLELLRADLFSLDNPYWCESPSSFAERYLRSVRSWGGPLLCRAFQHGDGAPTCGKTDALVRVELFLSELEERVAAKPGSFRQDYVEAAAVCRKVR